MRYQCIARRRTQYPVRMMCRLLSVSRSGYYAWRVRPESERTKTDRELTRVIRRYHGESDECTAAPRYAMSCVMMATIAGVTRWPD